MKDEAFAAIARNLADALIAAAYSRATEDWKKVLWLQAELCAARRAEIEEQSKGREP